MNKIYQKSFPGEKNAGFTLIELLVVVLIIGILAAVALPQYEFAVKKTRMNNYLATFRSIKKSMEMYLLASGGVFPDTLKDLDMDLPGCDFRIIGSASYYDCQGVQFYYWGPAQVHIDLRGPEIEGLALYAHSAEKNQKIYCRASDSMDKKVCQALGGVLSSSSASESMYEMP